ncbi:MAG: hypothetical protein V4737_16740 [Curtobacterium sp.]
MTRPLVLDVAHSGLTVTDLDGLVIAAMGLVLAVMAAIGFALHGPVRPGRE